MSHAHGRAHQALQSAIHFDIQQDVVRLDVKMNYLHNMDRLHAATCVSSTHFARMPPWARRKPSSSLRFVADSARALQAGLLRHQPERGAPDLLIMQVCQSLRHVQQDLQPEAIPAQPATNTHHSNCWPNAQLHKAQQPECSARRIPAGSLWTYQRLQLRSRTKSRQTGASLIITDSKHSSLCKHPAPAAGRADKP